MSLVIYRGLGKTAHWRRVVRVLQDGQARARTVLEGLAEEHRDVRAAGAMIDYMIALGVLRMVGDGKGARYRLGRLA